MTDREHLKQMAAAYVDAAKDAAGIAVAVVIVYAALWCVFGG